MCDGDLLGQKVTTCIPTMREAVYRKGKKTKGVQNWGTARKTMRARARPTSGIETLDLIMALGAGTENPKNIMGSAGRGVRRGAQNLSNETTSGKQKNR